MKKIVLLAIALISLLSGIAQEIPQMISYQGKLYENSSPVDGTKTIKFTIGTWTETHSVQITNGLYSVQLGSQTLIPINTFANNSNVDLQITVEDNNLSPKTDILSVPYAYVAEIAVTAENVPTKLSELTNDTGYITSANDADADPSNEVQQLTKSGSNISLSKNGGVVSINDADADPSNEIQNLSINDNNLSISDGNLVTLPTFSLPYNESYDGSDDMFVLKSTGTSNKLAYLVVDNQNSNTDVLYLQTKGTGEALNINNDGTSRALYIHNDVNTTQGINIHHNGTKEALYVYHEGDDDCVHLQIDNSNSSKNVIVATTNGTGYAGKFNGNVSVTGSLSKGSGSFIIDHPTDPLNKYMYHSFVESPDMMNIYNGNVVLDENGLAKVQMPMWLEALNMNFRYQLTCIGGFSGVYISKKMENNCFEIAGGTAGLEVSWQVTGVRNDPYARENRIQVEVEKSGVEKGRYLHYKEYGQDYENSIEAIKDSKVAEKE